MRYLLLIAGIFAGEYRIKKRVDETWKTGETKPVCGGRLLLRKVENRGFVLHAGQKHQPFVAAVSVAMSVFFTVLFLATLGTRGQAGLKTGLAFLLGGAYSNTCDRIRRRYVVDYFSLGVPCGRLGRIVWNLSDFAILIGAMLVVLCAPGREA